LLASIIVSIFTIQQKIKIINTLVIHPADASTDFLIPIYSNLRSYPDFDDTMIIRDGTDKDTIREYIEKYDRVIMMGHGCSSGLFSVGQFEDTGMIIDHTMVEALSKKKESIYIWCNADQFVERHNLKGFYTGMFISEYSEASVCNVVARKGEVERSNSLFAQVVGRNINESVNTIWKRTIRAYHIAASEVTEYNGERLYLKN